jgi:hypothetical protein
MEHFSRLEYVFGGMEVLLKALACDNKWDPTVAAPISADEADETHTLREHYLGTLLGVMPFFGEKPLESDPNGPSNSLGPVKWGRFLGDSFSVLHVAAFLDRSDVVIQVSLATICMSARGQIGTICVSDRDNMCAI